MNVHQRVRGVVIVCTLPSSCSRLSGQDVERTSVSSMSKNISWRWPRDLVIYFYTFRRSPFFHKYPALMTLSSIELRGLACTSAVFQPPSTASSSSSVSSPLFVLRSAMEVRGGCDDVPAWRLEPPWPIDIDTSGVRIESESDSVPDTGRVDGYPQTVRTLAGDR